mmetsp:Transcript_47/g.164  ORF Transcript_47/g.164 Transcript_47/m.164 type:complete len:158 (-) Transcript_47:593-1066(-)
MPRYYCDYCDTYLTHESPVVRKQHNSGFKHKANVRNYYMQFEESESQASIDSKILAHLQQARPPMALPGLGPPSGLYGGRPMPVPGQPAPYNPPAGMGGPGPPPPMSMPGPPGIRPPPMGGPPGGPPPMGGPPPGMQHYRPPPSMPPPQQWRPPGHG